MIRPALYLIAGSSLFVMSLNAAHDSGEWLPVLASYFGGALMCMGVAE